MYDLGIVKVEMLGSLFCCLGFILLEGGRKRWKERPLVSEETLDKL